VIEKTYFGITNGAYTSYTIQGVGPEGLPFYNQNIQNIMAMGLLPYLNLFAKIEIQPRNIEVNNFKDDNTANVRYDVFINSGSGLDSSRIEMVVKKIGGYWKLDGEAFLGIKKSKNQQKKKIKQKKVTSSLSNSTPLEGNTKVLNPNVYSVNKVCLKNPDETMSCQPSTGLPIVFFINSRFIYKFINGEMVKRIRINSEIIDEGYAEYRTNEGKFIYNNYLYLPSGEIYDVEYMPANEANIDVRLLK